MSASGAAWSEDRRIGSNIFHIGLRPRTISYQLSLAPLPQRDGDSVTDNRDRDGQKCDDEESAVPPPPISSMYMLARVKSALPTCKKKKKGSLTTPVLWQHGPQHPAS